MLRIFCFILMIGIVNFSWAAENEAPPDISNYDQTLHARSGDWWVNWGVGAGLGDHVDGMGSIWNFSYQLKDNQIISARMSGLVTSQPFGEVQPFACYFTTPLLCNPTSGFVADTGFLYGYLHYWGTAIVTIEGGLGYVQSRDNNINGQRTRLEQTIGLPLESQLFWSYERNKGIGLILYADLNTKNPFVALAFSLHFGHLY